MRFLLLLAALTVCLGNAPSLHGQKVFRNPPKPGAASLGFMYGAPIAQAGDGRIKWAEYPTIKEVLAGSEAERLGIRAGDVILAVNGKDAHDPRLLGDRKPGTRYVLRLQRGEEEREVTVTVYVPEAEHPSAAPSSPRSSTPSRN